MPFRYHISLYYEWFLKRRKKYSIFWSFWKTLYTTDCIGKSTKTSMLDRYTGSPLGSRTWQAWHLRLKFTCTPVTTTVQNLKLDMNLMYLLKDYRTLYNTPHARTTEAYWYLSIYISFFNNNVMNFNFPSRRVALSRPRTFWFSW